METCVAFRKEMSVLRYAPESHYNTENVLYYVLYYDTV